jgi:hypothetical protein
MSVRVNKASFSIREKLSELERPIGLKGSELMRAETAQEARDFVSAGRKNLIINGDMKVHQRGGTTQDSNAFIVDRFRGSVSNLDELVTTYSQSSDAPAGFSNSLKVDIDTAETSLSANEFIRVFYSAEAQDLQHLSFGTSSAKLITLSFWVKTNVTGSYAINIWCPDSNRSTNSYYTVKSADVWEYKTITFPGDAVGSINNDNGIGMGINFMLAAGSDFTGGNSIGKWVTYSSPYLAYGQTANIMSSTSNYFNLTGVQLEVGKNATEFEHRSYGEELALCQRYYQRNKLDSGQYCSIVSGTGYSAGTFYGTYHLQTPMRVSPTSMGYSSLSHFSIVQTNVTTNPNPNAFAIDNGSGTQTLRIYATTAGATGLTPGYGAWIQTNNASAYIDFSAEL